MTTTSSKSYHKRGQVVQHARRLARSGQHGDHTTILRELEAVEGFALARARLQERAILSQLDKLCALARDLSDQKANYRAMRQ